MSDDLTNVTVKRELYEVERDGNTIEYDGMTMERVDRPTAECAAARWIKRRYRRHCRNEISPALPPGMNLNHLFDNPHADAAAVARKVASPFSSVTTLSCRFPQKITPGFIAVILSQMNGFFAIIPVRHDHHAAGIFVGATAAKGNAVRMVEKN